MAPKRERTLSAPTRLDQSSGSSSSQMHSARTLRLPRDRCERTPSPVQHKRARRLSPPLAAKKRFGTLARNRRVPAANLLEAQSEDDEIVGSSSDGTTSEEERQSARSRALKVKVRRRQKLFDYSQVHPTLADLTLLERSTVQSGTEGSYEQAVKIFLTWSDRSAGPLVEDAAVDDAIVRYMNEEFGRGMPAHNG